MGWCGCAVPREGDRVAADPPPDHAIRGSVSLPGSTAATASTSNMRGDLERIECVLTLAPVRPSQIVDERRDMVSAQVVWLGHGALRRLLPSDDGTLSSPRPIVSSTSNAIPFQPEHTEPFVRRL
jgi:hypothetical protein